MSSCKFPCARQYFNFDIRDLRNTQIHKITQCFVALMRLYVGRLF